MRRLIAVALLLASSGAGAEWYVDGAVLLPSSSDAAASASLGFIFQQGWYISIGAAEFDSEDYNLSRERTTTTETVTRIGAESQTRHYHALLGKLFPLGEGTDLYVQGGPAYYDSETVTNSDTTDRTFDASGFILSEETTHNYTTEETDRDISYLASFGVLIDAKPARVKFGVSYFEAIEKSVAEIGLAYTF